MNETLTVALPWVMSVIAVAVMYMAENRHARVWQLSMLNQVLSFIWIYVSGQYGFLIMTVGMAIVCVRNEIVRRSKL